MSDERDAYELRPRDPLGVADRAITNLDIVMADPDGHKVTAIVSAALAILILPFEVWFRDDASDVGLAAGASAWEVKPESDVATPLLQHVRNALAHGEITYKGVGSASPNSREPAEVWIQLQDRPPDGAYNWWAAIRADDLDAYLRALHRLLEDRTEFPGN